MSIYEAAIATTPRDLEAAQAFMIRLLGPDGRRALRAAGFGVPMIRAVIAVRPVGVLKMQDESGGDEKIIAVPVPRLTRRYEKVHNYTDLPEITIKQIEHFFEHYKDLEANKWVKVEGWGDAREAEAMILAAIERYKASKA